MIKKVLFTTLASLALCFNVNSQVVFSENFENGTNGWTFVDYDGDSNNWFEDDASSASSALGSNSIISLSYTNQPVQPDNLAISPAIDLTTVSASNLFLKYNYLTSGSYPQEKYSIYVTTSNDPSNIINSTPVHTETVSNSSGGTLQNKQIDLSSYIGQNVYITFRHYDCTDMLYLILDNIEVKSLMNDDLAVKDVSVYPYINTNQDEILDIELSNEGINTITSATINWNDGTNDHISTVSLNLNPGESTTIQHPIALNYSNVQDIDIDVEVQQVNSNSDGDTSNNQGSANTKTISQDAGAKVLIEEGTGTWCGWCPRGFVAMEQAEANFPDSFIGIAVHAGTNGAPDPMQNTEYINGASFGSFPGMNVNRSVLGASVSPSTMAYYINEKSVIPNPVNIDITPSLNGDNLSVEVDVNFYTNFTNSDFRIAAIIIEDGVTGTSNGYAQTNYYANNQNGPMDGWENLSNPVPAADMVYDHVGRALLGGYNGVSGSIPSNISDGDSSSYTFNYTIPSNYDASEMSVVALVIDNATGEVINSNKEFFGMLNTNSIAKNSKINLYPNPASGNFNVTIENGGNYEIKIYDLSGRIIKEKTSELYPSNSTINVDVSSLSQGTYLISVEGEKESFTEQLIIK